MHLYVHIPFCKQACHYCDFHFSTNRSRQTDMVRAIGAEIRLRKTYLPDTPLETIYVGGGTPSLLTIAELDELFSTIRDTFAVRDDAEITLEANPDDLTDAAHLKQLRLYVNRLSIGIQTFDEAALRWMNRAHTAAEAAQSVARARAAGFDNLSADLIYGLPNRETPTWEADMHQLLGLQVPHLSAYALTIEPDTAFGRWQRSGRIAPLDDHLAAEQFEQLSHVLTQAGYDHYEISNFALPGHLARHNTAYWQQKPYLGVGPGAHSYNGVSRQANVSHNAQYLNALAKGEIPAIVETLTAADRVNEYLLTGLRTQWGCSLVHLDGLLGFSFSEQQAAALADMQANGWLYVSDGHLLLTPAGRLFADRVAAALFMEREERE